MNVSIPTATAELPCVNLRVNEEEPDGGLDTVNCVIALVAVQMNDCALDKSIVTTPDTTVATPTVSE